MCVCLSVYVWVCVSVSVVRLRDLGSDDSPLLSFPCVFLCVCFWLSVSVCVSLLLLVCVCVSLFVTLFFPWCFLCVSLSVSVLVCLSLSFGFSVCFSFCLSVCLHVSDFLAVSLCLSLGVCDSEELKKILPTQVEQNDDWTGQDRTGHYGEPLPSRIPVLTNAVSTKKSQYPVSSFKKTFQN